MSARRSSNRVRVWALFALTSVLILGPIAPGNAATLEAASGRASGFAVGITVDIPGVPGFAGVDDRIIETVSQIGDVSLAEAALGDVTGTVASATSPGSSSSKNVASKSFPEPTPIFNTSAGILQAALSADRAAGEGALASLDAGLGGVHDTLFPDAVKGAFATVTATANDAIDDVNTALDGVLDNLAGVFDAVPLDDPLLGGLLGGTLGGTLTDPVALSNAIELPQIPNIATSTIVQVEDIGNATSTERTSDIVVADSLAQIGSIDVLGFLHLDAIDLRSHSQAEGTDGTAANTSSCSVSNLRIGDQDGIAFDGTALYVDGEQVPVPIGEVSTVKTVVDQLMADLGITVDVCDVVDGTTADDGTSASQTISALAVTISPQVAGQSVGTIVIDPAVTTEVSAQVAAPAAAPTTPTAEDTPALPFTGAGLLATVLSGIGIATGAVVLRRKLM